MKRVISVLLITCCFGFTQTRTWVPPDKGTSETFTGIHRLVGWEYYITADANGGIKGITIRVHGTNGKLPVIVKVECSGRSPFTGEISSIFDIDGFGFVARKVWSYASYADQTEWCKILFIQVGTLGVRLPVESKLYGNRD